MTAHLKPLAERTFPLTDTMCPRCKQASVIGFYFVNERDEHMHTAYACTFWASGAISRCGWTGWVVRRGRQGASVSDELDASTPPPLTPLDDARAALSQIAATAARALRTTEPNP